MSLGSLPPLLRDEPALHALAGTRSGTLAVPEPARALVIAGLAHLTERRPVVVAVPTTGEAERLADDLAAYAVDSALFPAWETLPFERVSPNVETMGRRLEVLWRLSDPATAPSVVVAPVRALVQRLGPVIESVGRRFDVDSTPDASEDVSPAPGGSSSPYAPVEIAPGDEVDPSALVERLVRVGYRREYQVEHRGEVAVRGSIVDVFPSTADQPVRIDLWGDEVDRLTTFSVGDQRSTDDVARAVIFPARELLPTPEVRERAERLAGAEPWGREQWERLAAGEVFDGMESWLPWLVDGDHLLTDAMPAGGQILLLEPRRLRDRASDLVAEEADLAASLATTWGATAGEKGELHRLHLDGDALLAHTGAAVWSIDSAPDRPDAPAVEARGWDPTLGDPEKLARRLSDMVGEGYRVVIAADGDGSARRMAAALGDHGIHAPVTGPGDDLTKPGVRVAVQPLERGAVLAHPKLAVLSESDVTGRRRAHRRARPRPRDAGRFFDDLQAGDFVVHEHHGVARYEGMVTRDIGGTERDYLLLAYKGGDKLYVPTDQIHTVRHYTGGDVPTLHRMGGSDFARTKAKVRSAVREIAQELVVLYQRRVTTEGVAFSHDTPWQAELEDTFPYQETPDQLKAVEEVKADMETPQPMDRLVCGDVGFGKTEVAIRGVFKAVQDGYQAAVLVPTTLLAQQHFQTFSERYAGFPVRVEVLSRFLTTGQAKKVVDALADGTVDVVIGTHRLLSEDIRFKKLGLLVVDEEQRFGVTHKERIKQLRADVDVLTLTATPIPRTLEMSLTGIRDLTLLNTPPAERQPILTYVGEYDDRAVAEAIRRELLREGQVFFVHNRVHDIDEVVAHIRELVPEARIAVAHGQMDEGTLEKVVIDFWDGEYDVLVCTTIIESGIDMPTVNTLVVDRADLMGLGQLHQLRGRVGRAGQRAYAYLLYPPDYRLTEEAYERLKTIGEQTELGSGFKIAMRDLEIRGAGNLLGHNQTGHIAAVGYDLYCRMVTEAVAELKGETLEQPAEITIDVPLDAHIPTGYIAREDLRIEAYRRLAAVATELEVIDIRQEWEDRYGPVPEPAEALLVVARLRAECHRLGVTEVVAAGRQVRIKPVHLKMSEEVRLGRLVKGAVYKEPESLLVLPLREPENLVEGLLALLRDLVPPPASVAS